jgi:hypothetical protein
VDFDQKSLLQSLLQSVVSQHTAYNDKARVCMCAVCACGISVTAQCVVVLGLCTGLAAQAGSAQNGTL